MLAVLEAGKFKTERPAAGEGPLAASPHGRRRKGEREREKRGLNIPFCNAPYKRSNGVGPFTRAEASGPGHL